jgi:PAS domain S-box-containing protein
MRFVSWRGLSERYRHAVDGHSPWTRDTVDPQPIWIEDVAQADLPDELKRTVLDEGIAALAFIPLMSGDRLIGKFMTYYRQPHPFTPAQVNLAVTIARQIGFGIERVRADDARRRAEDKLRHFAAIVESSDDAIVSKDLNSVIQSWNRGAEQVFGYTADEAIGQNMALIFPADRLEEENDILNRIRRGDRVEHFETIRRHKSGRLLDVSLTISPLKDASGTIIGASKIARDITERKRAEAQRELLVAELSHRVKNTLATVVSIQHQSFSKAQSVDDGRRSFTARIRALAQTHGRLADGDWSGVSLEATFRDELAPYAREDGSNVSISGPPITLTPKGAVTLGMAVHELATNAAKYGALSVKDGLVTIDWRRDANQKLVIRWTESGGPKVTPPSRQGFGRVLLERALAADLHGDVTLHFNEDGLQCTIVLPFDDQALRIH